MITGEASMTARGLEKALEQDYDVVWSHNHRTMDFCQFDSTYDGEKELDITDYNMLESVANMVHPDIIVHTAAYVNTKLCQDHPYQAIDSNVKGTYNVATVANKVNSKIVYFSTTAIYDVHEYSILKPIVEDTPKKPATIYGITKYAGELLCHSMIPKDKLLVIRPCFMYGGKFDHASAFCKAIRSAVEGNTIDVLLNPDCYKDYFYLTDAMAAVKCLLDNEALGDYNISQGFPRTFARYMEVIADFIGKPPHIIYHPETDYMHNHIVDNAKLRKFGWAPRVDVEEGLRLSYNDIYNK